LIGLDGRVASTSPAAKRDSLSRKEAMPDVTRLIEADHREVEGLFAQFKQDRSKATATTICEELDAHASAEEHVFYPVVRDDVPDGRKLAKEGEDEHGEARQLIGRIKNTEDEDHLAELVQQLEEAVSHHVQEEESEMLPKSREALGAERLEQLGAEFEAAKQT
jgi:hemerythrin superfamily protein